MLGDADIAVGGGAESMSRAAYIVQRHALGRPHGRHHDGRHDGRRAARPVPQRPHGRHRRERRRQVTRSPATTRTRSRVESAPARGAARSRTGRFKEQILPVTLKTRKGETMFDTDEHVRADATPRTWRSCAPVFKKDGTVTAGNASGINDGAAAVVLMDGDAAKRRGLKPLARLVAYAHAGVDPKVMGIGPVPAVAQGAGEGRADDRRHRRDRGQRGLRRAGLRGRARSSASIRRRSTRTARASRSATRSAPPARSSRSRRSTSWSAPAAATRWSRCASAAARASRRSSSGSEPSSPSPPLGGEGRGEGAPAFTARGRVARAIAYFVMAGLDPAIRRDTKIGANRAPSRQSRVIAGSSPAMTIYGLRAVYGRRGNQPSRPDSQI